MHAAAQSKFIWRSSVDKRKAQAAESRRTCGQLGFLVNLLTRMNDIDFSMRALLDDKTNEAVYQKRLIVQQRLNYFVHVDLLWREAVLESNLVQWVKHQESLTPSRTEAAKIFSGYAVKLKAICNDLLAKGLSDNSQVNSIKILIKNVEVAEQRCKEKEEKFSVQLQDIKDSLAQHGQHQKPNEALSALLQKVDEAEKNLKSLDSDYALWPTPIKTLNSISLPLPSHFQEEEKLALLENDRDLPRNLLDEYQKLLIVFETQPAQRDELTQSINTTDMKLTEEYYQVHIALDGGPSACH